MADDAKPTYPPERQPSRLNQFTYPTLGSRAQRAGTRRGDLEARIMSTPGIGPMLFEPLYYADRLDLLNPAGDVGLVTLWTPLRTAKRVIRQISPDVLNPDV